MRKVPHGIIFLCSKFLFFAEKEESVGEERVISHECGMKRKPERCQLLCKRNIYIRNPHVFAPSSPPNSVHLKGPAGQIIQILNGLPPQNSFLF